MAFLPSPPDAGPFKRSFWRSPLRGPWLASFLSSALLPLIVICALTGFLSHAAYDTDLGENAVFGDKGGFDFYFFDWPSSPAWLYAVTQGLHIITGLAAIPILLAKLWAVIPKLFENPPVRSLAHGLERLGLALLVGGSLFVFATGVLNIQLWYPFGFAFVPAHYYAAFIFLAALAFHVGTKIKVMRRAYRDQGIVRPLRDDLEHTKPEAEPVAPERRPGVGRPSTAARPDTEHEETSAPANPAAPTLTRRALVATVGAGSVGLAVMGAGQVIGGPFRELAFLAPRGEGFGPGPNDFQVNKTFASVGIKRDEVGPDWGLVLEVGDERRVKLSREQLLAMKQTTEELPIACVEGWTTTQKWTGVRLSELARMAGAAQDAEVQVRSVQKGGAFNQATLNAGQLNEQRSLLALKVNGADLSLDHGFPARVIVPALPGVHCTKWVGKMVFSA